MQDMRSATTTEHDFKLKTFFIPTLAKKSGSENQEKAQTNHIGELCKEIESAATFKAQDNLHRLQNDSQLLLRNAKQILEVNEQRRSSQACRRNIAISLSMVSLSMVILSFLWVMVTFQGMFPSSLTDQELFKEIVVAITPLVTADPSTSALQRVVASGKFIGGFCIITFVASFIHRRAAHFTTLTKDEKDEVEELIGVFGKVLEKHDAIWERYSSDIDGKAA